MYLSAAMSAAAGQRDDDDAIDVLLVEDDGAIREMYQLKLQRDGYRVTTAVDGEEGIAKARELLPDIIFLDVRMPKKDGFQVLAELRADPSTADIPVIMLSNYGERDLVERGVSLGAKEYLIKAATTPGTVSSGIEEWVGR